MTLKFIKNTICPRCGKESKKSNFRRGVCSNCYRKYLLKKKLIICKRCKRKMPHQAKGYCPGCYNYVFHLDRAKADQCKRDHNIDYETYKKITKNCLICGFDKVVDLHHLDNKHENNNLNNLIGLCPNHHKMLHDFKFRDEIQQQINDLLKII
ncbi:hypothetical protein GOV12_02140 [Candidatus Pacearchaeota archaeon]|nr:hypothetical protein [Candidatus Pacearchaeota archaeon]